LWRLAAASWTLSRRRSEAEVFESVFEACGLGERSEFSFSRVRNLAMEDGPSRDLTLPSKRNDKPPEGFRCLATRVDET